MATPRKRYFRVADSVTREPWSNDVAATFLRLCGYLNSRWARDGLDGPSAGRADLRPGDIMSVTGRQRLGSARVVLAQLAGAVSITVRYRGDITEIDWPKFPTFQGLNSEVGADPGLDSPRDEPPPLPRPASRVPRLEEEEKREPHGVSPVKSKTRLTDAPNELAPEDHARVIGWMQVVMPLRLPEADRWIERCLTWHRSNGKKRADWSATVQDWIRRDVDRELAESGLPPLPSLAESKQIQRALAKQREENERAEREFAQRESA